jgi:hypothetical protein
MKPTTEVTIAGAEGLGSDLSSVGCYVSLDGRLHDVITPLNNQPGPDTAVLLPHEGEVRFIVKNMGGDDHVFGSVSLPLGLLPDTPGQLWLPLFERLDGDLLHTLPEEVDSPKILLILGTVSLLSPVQELTEGSRSSIEDDLEELHQGLLSRDPHIFDTPNKYQPTHELEKSQWRLRISTEEMQKELQSLQSQRDMDRENWTALHRRQSTLIDDLKSQVSGFEKLFKQEQCRANSLSSKLTSLNEQYEESQERMIERERNLMETIDERLLETSQLQAQVSELKESVRNLTSDKFQIEELYRQLQSQGESGAMAELQESLNLAVEQLAESEIARRRLQEELSATMVMPEPREMTANTKESALQESLLQEVEALHDRLVTLEGLLEEKTARETTLVSELTQLRPLKDAYSASGSELSRQRDVVSKLTQENSSLKDEVSALSSLLKDSHVKNTELQADIAGLQRETSSLSAQLEDMKRRPLKTADVIDFLIGKFFAERGTSVSVQKLGDELYAIGAKRVCLTLRNGGLSARVGSGYLLLEDYLKMYQPHEGRHIDPLSESTNSTHTYKVSPNRSLSVEAKSHRRVSTMPENHKETLMPAKSCEPEDELFLSANTSHVKQFAELDSENIPEISARGEELYTPSPIKKLTQGMTNKPNKTPKTPGRRAPSASKLTGKSIERLPRKVPFR